jgi:general secretion pathway protein H
MRGSVSHPSQQSGFTLIEILVVVIIISITVGFAMMSFGDFGKERKLIASGQKLAQFITLVHEKALFESRTLKMEITNQGYHVARLTANNQWVPLSGSSYSMHRFPTNTYISADTTGTQKQLLTLIFDASGDMTPFILYIGSAQHPRILSLESTSDGQLTTKMEPH